MNVEAEEPVIRVDIGLVGKYVKATRGKQLQNQGKLFSTGFHLTLQIVIEVFQRGGIAPEVFQILPINIASAAVDNRLLPRLNSSLCQLLKEGHNKTTFQFQRVLTLVVFIRNIHSIDIAAAACIGDHNDFTTHGVHKWAILSLRIDNDNIIVGIQCHRGHFLLCCHRLTGAGNTKDKAIAIHEHSAVADNQVAGNGVSAIVDTAGIHDFLCLKGHENGGAFRSQAAQGSNPLQPIGKHGIKAVLLLEHQIRDCAAVAVADRNQGFGILLQLFHVIRKMRNHDLCQEKALIPLCDVRIKFFRLVFQLTQVIWNRGIEIIVFHLTLCVTGNIGFNGHQSSLNFLDYLIRGNRQQVNCHHHVAWQIGKVGNHAISDEIGILPDEKDTAHLVAHLIMIVAEQHIVRCNRIPYIYSAFRNTIIVKIELRLGGTEEIVEQTHTFCHCDFCHFYIQAAKVGFDIGFRSLKKGTGLLNCLSLHGDGKILFLADIVAAFRSTGKNSVMLRAVMIFPVPFHFHQQVFLKLLLIHGTVI